MNKNYRSTLIAFYYCALNFLNINVPIETYFIKKTKVMYLWHIVQIMKPKNCHHNDHILASHEIKKWKLRNNVCMRTYILFLYNLKIS